MKYTDKYESPLGELLLAADDEGLTGLWYTDHTKYGGEGLAKDAVPVEELPKDHPSRRFFAETKRWLDLYFAGEEPDFLPPLHLIGTEFRKRVWKMLLDIPYGDVRTYGSLAIDIAWEDKIERMSAQAVGGAVGHNPISIIVPCHRILGSDGNLTGYAGGLERKAALLIREGHSMIDFYTDVTGDYERFEKYVEDMMGS